MPFLEDTTAGLAAEAPGWVPEALFWVAIGGLFVAILAAVGVWTLVARSGELKRIGVRLDTLAVLRQKLEVIASSREDLDLRRLEHVLIDVRDTQQRLEESLIRVIESRGEREGSEGLLMPMPSANGVAERVLNRLLALGYDQIHLVTGADELAELAARDGEVLIEAKKDGVLHKGRVLVRSGRLANVELNPAYSIFP